MAPPRLGSIENASHQLYWRNLCLQREELLRSEMSKWAVDIVTPGQIFTHLMVERRQRFGTMSIIMLGLPKSILLDTFNENLVSVAVDNQRTKVETELRLVVDHEGPSIWEPLDRVIGYC
jgi:hypothetical protein